jgi:replication initiation protein RepC
MPLPKAATYGLNLTVPDIDDLCRAGGGLPPSGDGSMEKVATTPFGGARLTARNFALRADMEQRQTRLRQGEAGNETGTAEKWQLIRALSEARTVWGLSDRAIAVLEALASFHGDRQLDGRAAIIVFPSNTELSIRARGMSPATLRRHLASLVEAGLILRRDSANGKRYCRRDDQGQVESAFGFDLAPLALRSDEIFDSAASVREEARRIGRLRAEITLHLRDIAKTIEAGLERAGASGLWLALLERLRGLSGRVARNGTEEDLTTRRDALIRLRAEVETAYLNSLGKDELLDNDLTLQQVSANAPQTEHHIQNSKTESHLDKNGQRVKPSGEAGGKTADGEGREGPTGQKRLAPERKSADISLNEVLRLCPDIADYAKGGAIASWHDLMGAAEVVRSMLGISPSAWGEAREAMGPVVAAITLAAMLQRVDAIRSPGGYLRDLTFKAQEGRFSVRPMLKALA